MKRKTWKSKLTAKELKHLKVDAGVKTLTDAKRNFEHHAEMRRTSSVEPCFECKHIARKLGLLVERPTSSCVLGQSEDIGRGGSTPSRLQRPGGTGGRFDSC
ncbi:MAG: hypothetical protein ACD_74C00157G0004 [uncultured bacterium]|jgi:hypothetical protein|nr:MAG: hypothetical protein ACD_74C00157G0004 [uncultured bacterium]